MQCPPRSQALAPQKKQTYNTFLEKFGTHSCIASKSPFPAGINATSMESLQHLVSPNVDVATVRSLEHFAALPEVCDGDPAFAFAGEDDVPRRTLLTCLARVQHAQVSMAHLVVVWGTPAQRSASFFAPGVAKAVADVLSATDCLEKLAPEMTAAVDACRCTDDLQPTDIELNTMFMPWVDVASVVRMKSGLYSRFVRGLAANAAHEYVTRAIDAKRALYDQGYVSWLTNPDRA